MPVIISVCIVMAYIGPNSKIIGNIENGSWHFSAIENIYKSLLWILVIFSVDFGSCLLTFILIWWFTKMNIFKMYLQMQKLMWYTLAIHQGYMVSEVSFLIYTHIEITIIDIFNHLWKIHMFITKKYFFQYLFQLPISIGADFTFGFKWLWRSEKIPNKCFNRIDDSSKMQPYLHKSK